MGRPSKLLFLQLIPDGIHVSQRSGGTTGHLSNAKDDKGSDLEPGRIRILHVWYRPNFQTEGAFDNHLEGRLSTGSEQLGLHQKVIGKNQGRIHNMVQRMVVRLCVGPIVENGWFWELRTLPARILSGKVCA